MNDAQRMVLLPYRFTLFSNPQTTGHRKGKVLLPYRFTLFSNVCCFVIARNKFYYLIDLHYSQTTKGIHTIAECFTTLQIYTILKHIVNSFDDIECFTTLQIYTILKQLLIHFFQSVRFTTLQIYTILKHNIRLLMCLRVLLPYRFTLFSNLSR